ncbi:hypothetical protein HPB51_013698 [Rhipicephalus microplus]|uniref:Uncharacterized protein n=1 Tax=Rhipicephalus microplus TaxID=6941 RepID=A0A9J6F2L9_RHIMP|nr:hypothetical protein HPB51_013698 [Rhipicephalus microplus]
MMSKPLSLFMIALITATRPLSAQVIDIGSCPAVKVQERLDPNKRARICQLVHVVSVAPCRAQFSGKWFEIERTFVRRSNQRLHCVSVEYYYDGQGKVLCGQQRRSAQIQSNALFGCFTRTTTSVPSCTAVAAHCGCTLVLYVWILCRNHTVTEPYLANLRGYVQQWTGIPTRLFSKTPCK